MDQNKEHGSISDAADRLMDGFRHPLVGQVGSILFDEWNNLPLAGTVVRLIKFYSQVGEKDFEEKLSAFLTELAKIQSIDRERFLADHLTDDMKRRRLGVKLLTVIDRLDETQKAKWLGQVFCCYVAQVEGVDLNNFTRLAAGIESANIYDLNQLIHFGSKRDAPEADKDLDMIVQNNSEFEAFPYGLIRCGFARQDFKIHEDFTRQFSLLPHAKISDLGYLFAKCVNRQFS